MSGAVPGAVHKGRAGPARGRPRATLPQPPHRAAAALAPAPRATATAAAVAMLAAALLRVAPGAGRQGSACAQTAGWQLPASEHVAAARPALLAASGAEPPRRRGGGGASPARGGDMGGAQSYQTSVGAGLCPAKDGGGGRSGKTLDPRA